MEPQEMIFIVFFVVVVIGLTVPLVEEVGGGAESDRIRLYFFGYFWSDDSRGSAAEAVLGVAAHLCSRPAGSRPFDRFRGSSGRY